MKNGIRISLVLLNGLLVLLVINGAIRKKNAVVETGQTLFLRLAPVDPRSLMQGDYMALAYAFPRDGEFKSEMEAAPTRGKLLLEVDSKGIGTFSRLHAEEGVARKNEVYLKFRKWRRGFRFGIESFFFQEGLAKTYDEAKFAELKIGPNGDAVLIDLRGENLQRLIPGSGPTESK